MAADFGNLYDFDAMTDEEIYDVIVQHLRENTDIDVGWLDVRVRDGQVTLGGTVATDGEAQIVEKILVEVLGVPNLKNELVVSELHRGTLPEAIDDTLAIESEQDEQMGGRDDQQTDTAAHLTEDLDAATYGTHDMQQAIEQGTAYEPPEGPFPDGYTSREEH